MDDIEFREYQKGLLNLVYPKHKQLGFVTEGKIYRLLLEQKREVPYRRLLMATMVVDLYSETFLKHRVYNTRKNKKVDQQLLDTFFMMSPIYRLTGYGIPDLEEIDVYNLDIRLASKQRNSVY